MITKNVKIFWGIRLAITGIDIKWVLYVYLRPSAVKKITPLREIQKIRKNTLYKLDVKLKALPYAHQLEKRYKTSVCRP
jgi:hypothetical protein